MGYSSEQVDQLKSELCDVRDRIDDAVLEITRFSRSPGLDENAGEFLLYGAARRLRILGRCATRIYEVFPPGRTEVLGDAEVLDVDINLHALILNVFGVLDNLGWAHLCQAGLWQEFSRKPTKVDLFKVATQRHLPVELRN